MTRERRNSTIGAIAILAAAAALATSLMSAAGAAPPQTKQTKHSKVTVVHHKKPIVIKMVGDRRAAENFAEQAYADVLNQRQAAADAAAARERANESNARALAQQQSAAYAWANGPYSPYTSVVVPAVSPYAFPGVTNPTNVVAAPYGAVQTITIPGNIYGGAPTINTFGTYNDGNPYVSSIPSGGGVASFPANNGGFYNFSGSFYHF